MSCFFIRYFGSLQDQLHNLWALVRHGNMRCLAQKVSRISRQWRGRTLDQVWDPSEFRALGDHSGHRAAQEASPARPGNKYILGNLSRLSLFYFLFSLLRESSLKNAILFITIKQKANEQNSSLDLSTPLTLGLYFGGTLLLGAKICFHVPSGLHLLHSAHSWDLRS